jgi:RNA polymerase sigma factor (TIGR02999 family)
MASSSKDIRRIVEVAGSGREPALNQLVPLVYKELRRLAAGHLRHERRNHTLQPTGLVHEVYLRLAGDEPVSFESWAHFRGIAARVMRRVLVEHARARGARKRGGSRVRVSLEDTAELSASPSVDFSALDEALERLSSFDARQARLVELRFFGGMTQEEAARALGLSVATVKREWALARTWLRRELEDASK